MTEYYTPLLGAVERFT